MHRLRNPEHEISIAVVGKYAEHRDAYKSIYEALDHAGVYHRAQVRIQRIHSEAVEREGPERLLAGVDGILVPGGFGERGIEGKVDAVRFARERGIPFFGICLGMQCAVAEFARNVLGLERANSTEFDKDTPQPGHLPAERAEDDHRQGRHDAAGGPAHAAGARQQGGRLLRDADISERHRHRYEFNNVYRQQFAADGMQVVGTSPDGTLVEVVEIPDHPWFIGVQYHPEFKSQPTRPHPLFAGFVGAARRASPGPRRAGQEASGER